jgi:hypothetical protein
MRINFTEISEPDALAAGQLPLCPLCFCVKVIHPSGAWVGWLARWVRVGESRDQDSRRDKQRITQSICFHSQGRRIRQPQGPQAIKTNRNTSEAGVSAICTAVVFSLFIKRQCAALLCFRRGPASLVPSAYKARPMEMSWFWFPVTDTTTIWPFCVVRPY